MLRKTFPLSGRDQSVDTETTRYHLVEYIHHVFVRGRSGVERKTLKDLHRRDGVWLLDTNGELGMGELRELKFSNFQMLDYKRLGEASSWTFTPWYGWSVRWVCAYRLCWAVLDWTGAGRLHLALKLLSTHIPQPSARPI